MNYSQEELNQILLSKPLNDFYLAIIENRGKFLTDQEYEKIVESDNNIYGGNSKESFDDFYKAIQKDEKSKKRETNLMKLIYSLSQIRYTAILTLIDDKVYNIMVDEFINLKRNKIVHYENFTNYYDETNARIRFLTPEEKLRLNSASVLLDIDGQALRAYQNAHIAQKEKKDLTDSFFAECKGKPHVLSRKRNNNYN